MILNTDKIEDIEKDNFGFVDENEGEVSIDSANMAFFYEMMSKTMYKDAKGSIVRELISNCFDAHREVGSNGVVVLEGGWNESNYTISFIDKGIGISPSRWIETFTKYLSSTKRQSNDFLGCMGLGSKSPFSYVDVYDVITIWDNIEYHYIMYKKENGIPGFDLLKQTPTSSRNGTTVRFIVEDGKYGDDWREFQIAIEDQLMYFDNVYVKDFNIENEYKIYDGKYFKYRIDSSADQMHALLGIVKYPIDWKILGLDEINIPVGVKFEIGTLNITPNRESLRYTEETKNTLRKGIELAIKELKSHMDNGYDTIEEYQESLDDTKTRKIKVIDGVIIPFAPGWYYDKKGESSRWPFILPAPYIKSLKGLPITIPKNPYFQFKVRAKLQKGRWLPKNKDESLNIWEYLKCNVKIPLYRTSNFESDKYKNFIIQEGYLIEKKKLTYKEIGSHLGLFPMKASPKIPHRTLEDESPKPIKKLKGEPLIGEWGNKLSIIKQWTTVITKRLVTETQSYDKFPLTVDHIKSYKEDLEERRPRTIRKQESLYANNIALIDGSKEEFTEKRLKQTGFIVYGENSQKANLKVIYSLIKERNRAFKNKDGRVFLVLMVNKTDLKRMKEVENAFDLEEFAIGQNTFKKRNRVFIQEATRLIIKPIVTQIKIAELVRRIVPSVDRLYKEVTRISMDTHHYNIFLKTTLGEELIKLIKENKWYDETILKKAELLLKISEDLAIFNKIKIETDLDYDEQRDFANILIKKGYMPDPIYTIKLTEVEKEWMENWINQGLYAQEIKIASQKASYSRRSMSTSFTNLVEEKAWKSYPKSLKQNKSDKISMLLLETRLLQ